MRKTRVGQVADKVACRPRKADPPRSCYTVFALDLATTKSVRIAAAAMRAAGTSRCGVQGFIVQGMVRRPHARELIVGDSVFGPVILFGEGGTAVEVIRDRAVGLPPLNLVLARELNSRTRVARLLAGYRDHPPADADAVCRTLSRSPTW